MIHIRVCTCAQWRNEGEQGRAAAPGRRWKGGAKWAYRYIFWYIWGSNGPQRGAKLGFSGNFGKKGGAQLGCVSVDDYKKAISFLNY